VGEVPNSNLSLLVKVCQKGSAIVDAEIEDAVLVWGFERDAKDSGVGSLRKWR